MAAEIHRITQETLDKLKAEYLELTTVGRTEIARVIESARLLGDLSENGDYHAAKDTQGKMESRIYEGDDEADFQEFFIGSIEEKPENVLVASPTSPLGAALLERRVGETVDYEAPSGILRVKIVGLR